MTSRRRADRGNEMWALEEQMAIADDSFSATMYELMEEFQEWDAKEDFSIDEYHRDLPSLKKNLTEALLDLSRVEAILRAQERLGL